MLLHGGPVFIDTNTCCCFFDSHKKIIKKEVETVKQVCVEPELRCTKKFYVTDYSLAIDLIKHEDALH